MAQPYYQLVKRVLREGSVTETRNGYTFSKHSMKQRYDLSDGFPLLQRKTMTGYVWNSLIHEFLWYLSGEEHIRNLREETGIWDEWADEKGRLQTSYARYWRRYPFDPSNTVEGEVCPTSPNHRWVDNPDIDSSRWVNENEQTFDQIRYIIDMLNERPHSRRLVVVAWHPPNAAVSKLPPCHYTFTLNVIDGKLHTHLTQRSGDIALGVPFNIACYSLLTHAIANQTPYDPGEFTHEITNAHIYCGQEERGEWYAENEAEVQRRAQEADNSDDFRELREFILNTAPDDSAEDIDPNSHVYGFDHTPGLLEQTARPQPDLPELSLANKPLDELVFDDIDVASYTPHGYIRFEVSP